MGKPGLEELQDFIILEVLMFYPDEEQQDLIRITGTWEQIKRLELESGSNWVTCQCWTVQKTELESRSACAMLSQGLFRTQNLRADQLKWVARTGQFRRQNLRADQLVRCSARDGSEIKTWEQISLSGLSVLGSLLESELESRSAGAVLSPVVMVGL